VSEGGGVTSSLFPFSLLIEPLWLELLLAQGRLGKAGVFGIWSLACGVLHGLEQLAGWLAG
jgi:hypothetical protein